MRSRKHVEAGEAGMGRLGTFTLLGAAAGSIPLPWVPGTLNRRVRGALVQDVAARHGVSLSSAARAALAHPNRSEQGSRATREAMRFLAVRVLGRLGPMNFFAPVRSALSTFVLGHLFERYLATREDERPARIEEDEALSLRSIIDRALIHALSPGVSPPRHEGVRSPEPTPEEPRDEMTQAVDGFLIATAGVPSWLVSRLDAAFDDMLANG